MINRIARAHSWLRARRLELLLSGLALFGWVISAKEGAGEPLLSLCGGADYDDRIFYSAQFALMQRGSIAIVVGLVAMAVLMVPLMAGHLRHVYWRSFTALRPVTIMSFAAAFLGTWVVANSASAVLAFVLRVVLGSVLAIALFLPAVLIWQISPLRQRSLNRCHRCPPLAAFGIDALASAAAYGFQSGFWCVATCWSMMTLALLCGAGHHIAMGVAVLVAAYERLLPPAAPRWRIPLSVSNLPRSGWLKDDRVFPL